MGEESMGGGASGGNGVYPNTILKKARRATRAEGAVGGSEKKSEEDGRKGRLQPTNYPGEKGEQDDAGSSMQILQEAWCAM